MRPAPPTLGTTEIAYPLERLFANGHSRYVEKSKEFKKLEAAVCAGGVDTPVMQLFQVRDERIEAGVITLLTATSLLELILYRFATSRIHFKSYDDHFDRLSLESKWILVPRICSGIEVDEACGEINALHQLIKARNCIVHPKVKWMTADNPQFGTHDKELATFHIACTNARRTVEDLVALLKPSKK